MSPSAAASSTRLGGPGFTFCCRASGKYTEWRPFSGSHGGDDNHKVGRNVGDAGKEVGGQTGQVALRELAGREDLQHIGRLERGTREKSGTPCVHLSHPITILQHFQPGALKGRNTQSLGESASRSARAPRTLPTQRSLAVRKRLSPQLSWEPAPPHRAKHRCGLSCPGVRSGKGHGGPTSTLEFSLQNALLPTSKKPLAASELAPVAQPTRLDGLTSRDRPPRVRHR